MLNFTNYAHPIKLSFRLLPGTYAVCRLPPHTPIPVAIPETPFISITRSDDELSIVCAEPFTIPESKCESAWACLKLEGPFPFSQTGVLSSFIAPLADHKIPIFAVSTFDTDYVLVKNATLEAALSTLEAAGHHLIPS